MGYQMFAGWRSSTLTWCDIYNNSDTQLVEYSDVPLYGDFSGSGNHFYGYKSAVYINGEDSVATAFEYFLIFRENTSISWYANGSHTNNTYDNDNGYFCLNRDSTLANRQIVDITHIDNLPVFRDRQEWLDYVQTPYTPPYTWQSVPSISGKNGISLLSIIKNSAINSGDAVSGASADAFDRLEETTKISTLIQGITEETPIIYSDDVNYMSITPTANNTCTLKFYLHGSVIYTLTDVSINAYLSFLIDETNGIMKPSIIYEDS